jgi:hypothetical protein
MLSAIVPAAASSFKPAAAASPFDYWRNVGRAQRDARRARL